MTPYEEAKVVTIDYTNYHNDRRTYRILPKKLAFGTSTFHPGPEQWFLLAVDVDRDVQRTFAMKGIHSWRPEDDPR